MLPTVTSLGYFPQFLTSRVLTPLGVTEFFSGPSHFLKQPRGGRSSKHGRYEQKICTQNFVTLSCKNQTDLKFKNVANVTCFFHRYIKNIASPEVGWQLKKILPGNSKLVPSVRKKIFIQGLARLNHARKNLLRKDLKFVSVPGNLWGWPVLKNNEYSQSRSRGEYFQRWEKDYKRTG